MVEIESERMLQRKKIESLMWSWQGKSKVNMHVKIQFDNEYRIFTWNWCILYCSWYIHIPWELFEQTKEKKIENSPADPQYVRRTL